MESREGNNRLKYLGNIGVGGERGDVFDPIGLCPSQSATQYKDAIKHMEIIHLGKADGWELKLDKLET